MIFSDLAINRDSSRNLLLYAVQVPSRKAEYPLFTSKSWLNLYGKKHAFGVFCLPMEIQENPRRSLHGRQKGINVPETDEDIQHEILRVTKQNPNVRKIVIKKIVTKSLNGSQLFCYSFSQEHFRSHSKRRGTQLC